MSHRRPYSGPHPLFAALTLLGLSAGLAACGHAPQEDPRTRLPLVRTLTVQPAAAQGPSFTGTVAARVQSDLGFRVAGKVVKRLVDTGQAVKAGQPLMRIDATDLRLATLAQTETVAAAKAHALQAAADEQRYRDLVPLGAVSASAYELVKATADAARAQLSAAEAQAGVARNETGYALLLADADGIVVDTLAEPGQVVAAGQVVVRVAHAGAREAVVDLPETLRPALGSTGVATLYGDTGTGAGTARLRQLSGAASRVARTFEARYVLEGALAAAPLGATVSIRLADGAASQGQAPVQVPLGAIYDRGQGPGVWLVNAAAQGANAPTVRWRGVALAGLGEENASVSTGLKAGDRIVALGAHLLHEGEQVTVADGRGAAR